jgi:hypothetical protein
MGKNHSAILQADFESVSSHLRLHPAWGAETIRLAGAQRWQVYAAQNYSKGPFGARVIGETPNHFILY